MKNIIIVSIFAISIAACSNIRFDDALDGRSFQVNALSVVLDDSVSEYHRVDVSTLVNIPVTHFTLSFDEGDAVMRNQFGFEEFKFSYRVSGKQVYEIISMDSLSTECCGSISAECSGKYALEDKGSKKYLFISKRAVFMLTER